MSQAEISLKEIPLEFIEKLRNFYKVGWPKYIVAYNFIDNMLKRYQKYPEHRELVRIFCINGIVSEDATFIGLMHDKDLLIGTLDQTFDKLQKLLHLMDFSVLRHFMCTKQLYRSFVLDFITKEKFDKIIWDDETIMMHLKKEEALKFQIDLPEGLELRSLSVEDTFKVNDNWPHKANASEKFIEYCIKFNPSVGLYNQEGELLSWCLSHDFRLLLNLFTDKNHLRKGYAEIVTKAISKKLAEDGYDVTASIIVKNVKSLNLFNKLGFNEIDRNYFIGVLKNSDD